MLNLKLYLLGPPRVELDGDSVNIKRRKALAMLIYLAVNGQAYSRDALATLFYPDHSQSRARAYLRRDLAVLNTSLAGDWFEADRETVQFNEDGDLWLDVARFRACLAECHSHDHPPHLPCAGCLPLLSEAVELYRDDFLAGFTLRDCPEFDDWQFFQAESLRQQLATALERLVQGCEQQDRPEAAIPHARRWVALDPLHESAQRALIQLYDRSGQTSAALRQYEEYAALLEEELGLPPEEETQTVYEAIKAKRLLRPYVRRVEADRKSDPPREQHKFLEASGHKEARAEPVQAGESLIPARTPSTATGPAGSKLELEQEIGFCTSFDGTRLAYATAGHGPPLVKAANWLSHLEYDWQSPVWRHWLAGLAEARTLVRYDKRGCGLSDWEVNDFSLSAQVKDLERVVDAVGLERFPLLGLSGGGPVAIAYAARHPEKVSHLILYGSYACGRLKRNQTLEQLEEAQMLFKAMELGWGKANPAFRQLYTGLFLPEGTAEQIQWYNELQRISTSPEIAVRMFKASAHVDVTDLAPQVCAPTLILHGDQDAVSPIEQSRDLAGLIPDARLVSLESKNHILLEHEPAWLQFLDEVHQFLRLDIPEQESAGVSSISIRSPSPSRQEAMPRLELPFQPTPFIGREKELGEIRRLLVEEPDCRLLTLVGPGGIGKTRLALEAAAQTPGHFPQGVYFVPLASVSEPEYIGPAIAQALNLTFRGGVEPTAQLLHYLRDKKLLLIVDNFEHLPGGTELIMEILQAAPQVKLLMTSRERLNLQEEWNYPVQGMPFPRTIEEPLGEDSEVLTEYGAVRLFLQRAGQAEASFVSSAQDMPHIIRICQLVDGMPLGLELAAPWVRLMSCQEIAEEIERNFDLLATTLRNVPERHRSLRAIFAQAWARLSEAEQGILSKLAVFQGGCFKEAAIAVSGATLAQLSSLVDRALLGRTSNGRYEMHELIRQFAAEQLQQDPVEFEEARNRHSSYYTQFLGQQIPKLKGDCQKEALAAIAADIDNVRAAWQRATDRNDTEALDQGAESLWFFGEFRGALFEIETLFEQTVTALTSTAAMSPDPEPDLVAEQESLIGFLLAAQGYLRARQHKLEAGHSLAERGLAKLRQAQTHDRQKEASALLYLGYVLHFQGRYAEVKQVAEESLALFSEIGDRWNQGWTLFLLGSRAQWSGQLAEAERYLQESKAIYVDLGDFLIRSYANLELGQVALKRGEYDRAKYLLNEALRIKQEFGDALGMADTLRDLGRLAIAEGDYTQAIELMQKSLAIFGESGGEWVVAARLGYLGTAFRLQGDFETAATYLQESLTSLRTSGQKPDTARNLSKLGCLAYDRQDYPEAERLQQEALGIWEEVGNEPELASVLRYLGHMAAKTSGHQGVEPHQHYQQALQLAIKHQVAPVALDIFVGVAPLVAERGERPRALELLFLAQHHSASTAKTRGMAHRYQAELSHYLSSEAVAAAKARAETLDWRATASGLIEELFQPGEAKPQPPPNLPAQTTPFIGRVQELAEISDLLNDTACRLLTVVGPGGIGKTRLALEVAGRTLATFRDGVYFVPLAPLDCADSIVGAVAEQVDFLFSESGDLKQQLLNFLSGKQLLLVIDNFEHLLAGAELVAQILEIAPAVKILVTSRERLNLRGETVYLLTGLEIPDSTGLKDTLEFDAARLFLQQARLVRPNFQLRTEERAEIKQICRLTQGMPLALVLAAGWLEMLTIKEIEVELNQNLDFLETENFDVPERQRSVRAAFNYSWTRLTAEAQQVFARLSIFRGGFTLQAAKTVTGADLKSLRSLVSKSLLTRNETGRYEIHELLRQYGEEQLEDSGEANKIRNAHRDFFLNMLYQREDDFKGRRQLPALKEIDVDLENIKVAWLRAVRQRNEVLLDRSLEGLWIFLYIRNRFQLGAELISQALDALVPPVGEAENLLGGRLLARLSHMQIDAPATRRGEIEGQVRHSLSIAQAHHQPLETAISLMILGMYHAYASLDYGQAVKYFEQSIRTFQVLDAPFYLSLTLHRLGYCWGNLGQLDKWRRYTTECLDIAQKSGNRAELALAKSNLIVTTIIAGNYTAAENLCREIIALGEAVRMPLTLAHAKAELGLTHFLLGDFELARGVAAEALELSQNLNWAIHVALSTAAMGLVESVTGGYEAAKKRAQESLHADERNPWAIFQANFVLAIACCGLGEDAAAWQYIHTIFAKMVRPMPETLVLWPLPVAAILLARQNQKEQAVELLAMGLTHPLSPTGWQKKWPLLTELRTTLENDLDPDDYQRAWERGKSLDLETVVSMLMSPAELKPEIPVRVASESTSTGKPFVEEALIATGGMGKVYLGRDVETGQPVAIKRLKPELVAQNPEAIKRFMREGEVLRRLNHPNIVKVLATFEEKDQPVIVMEYVAGGSLQDLLDRQPQLPLEQVLHIGLELADALVRVHHLDILHRDLKPGNVLLAEDGTPRLTDFGVAALLQADTRLTQEGTILGTSAYLSPEAWRGQTLDACSDIWSFGAVLYEMLAGRPPFAAKNAVAIMTAILNDPLPDLTRFRPETPPALVELIEHMLVKERVQRLDSMRQVAAGLETIRRAL